MNIDTDVCGQIGAILHIYKESEKENSEIIFIAVQIGMINKMLFLDQLYDGLSRQGKNLFSTLPVNNIIIQFIIKWTKKNPD